MTPITISRLQKGIILIAAFITCVTLSYQHGQIAAQIALREHDRQLIAEREQYQRRFEILAAETDYVTLLDAQQKWSKDASNDR